MACGVYVCVCVCVCCVVCGGTLHVHYTRAPTHKHTHRFPNNIASSRPLEERVLRFYRQQHEKKMKARKKGGSSREKRHRTRV